MDWVLNREELNEKGTGSEGHLGMVIDSVEEEEVN